MATKKVDKKNTVKARNWTVRSPAQALSQLATSINKLADKIIDYQYSNSETKK